MALLTQPAYRMYPEDDERQSRVGIVLRVRDERVEIPLFKQVHLVDGFNFEPVKVRVTVEVIE